MILALLLIALAVVAVVYLVRIYNGLVVLRENVRKAWANIDVLLTQRHDELPKLVETSFFGIQVVMHARLAKSAITRIRNRMTFKFEFDIQPA